MEDRVQHGLEEQEVTLERDQQHECDVDEQTLSIMCVFDALALQRQACEEETTPDSITLSSTRLAIGISGHVKRRCGVVSIHKRDREATSCSAPAGGALTRGLFH